MWHSNGRGCLHVPEKHMVSELQARLLCHTYDTSPELISIFGGTGRPFSSSGEVTENAESTENTTAVSVCATRCLPGQILGTGRSAADDR